MRSTTKKSATPAAYSVSALSRITGSDRKTIDKAIARAQIKPAGTHKGSPLYALADVQTALASKPEKTLRDEKLLEEIRKLRIRNDQIEGKLIPRSVVNAATASTIAPMTQMLTQKLENEFPALCVGLDVPGIRVKGKQLNDAIRAEFRKLCEAWPE